jgi:peroxiredoxin
MQITEKGTDNKEIAGKAKRKRYILVLVMFSLVMVIAGSWYLFQQKDLGKVSPKTSTEHSGILAPNFSLTDLDGNTFRLSDYKGSVVVIGFMATWCSQCRLEMSHYKVLWEKYGEKQDVILMSIDIDPRESEETLRAFAQEFPYATWIWARDTANLAQAYQVTVIPKTVIIDKNGYIRFTHNGVTDVRVFIEGIEQLLKEDEG